jgi:opacity protein-like surface antigen
MRWTWIPPTVIAVGLFLAHDAKAQGRGTSYAELVAGIAMPLGEDDYENLIDNSPKFGVRIGWLGLGRDSRAGLELGLDYTPVDNDVDELPGVEADVGRLRVLAGARIAWRLQAGSALFVRGGVGVDHVSAELTGGALGISVTAEGESTGLALEAGAGVMFAVSRSAYLGLQLAIPVAIHDDEPDADDDLLDLDYTGYDLDGLVTLGTRF